MRRNAGWLLALTLAAGLVAVGCGGGDDNDTTTTASLTKPEWIAKADSICKQGAQELNQTASQQFGNQRPTEEQVQQFNKNNLLPKIQSEVDSIRALGAPSGDEDQVNKLLDTVQAEIDKAKSEPSIENSTFADGNALANQYGLKVCGQG
jgi:hypothetical protein